MPGGRQGRFAAGVAGADHDDVIRFGGVRHGVLVLYVL